VPTIPSVAPKRQAVFPKAYSVAVPQSTIWVVIVNLQKDIPYHISLQFCINTLGKKKKVTSKCSET